MVGFPSFTSVPAIAINFKPPDHLRFFHFRLSEDSISDWSWAAAVFPTLRTWKFFSPPPDLSRYFLSPPPTPMTTFSSFDLSRRHSVWLSRPKFLAFCRDVVLGSPPHCRLSTRFFSSLEPPEAFCCGSPLMLFTSVPSKDLLTRLLLLPRLLVDADTLYSFTYAGDLPPLLVLHVSLRPAGRYA